VQHFLLKEVVLEQTGVGKSKYSGVRGSLSDLDDGLLWKFADIEVSSGEVYTGQVIGVYNEVKFMWNPTEFSTLSIFTCSHSTNTLADFRLV
jgi:hypothetical protein